MPKNYKIAITTGDKKGIGKELVFKALSILKPDKNDVLIIGEKIDLDYDFLKVDIEENGKFCYETLNLACSLAKNGTIKGLVTAPVSKYELHKSGYYFNGQTEVIEDLLAKNSQRAQMIFIADNLKVMLLTRHLPLKEVSLTIDEVVSKTEILVEFLKNNYGLNNPKIGLCAFNPHAGEGGILGSEEIEILNPAVKILKDEGIDIDYPKSADALFSKVGYQYLHNEKLDYDAILACYHDQGLCPIKALAFDKAINTTIGLPIIRTSPSSGTAYDIAGMGIADPSSMVEAVKLGLKLSK